MSPEPLDMPHGLPFYVQRETQICGQADNQTIDDNGAFDHSFSPYTARVKYHKGYNGGHHRGFKLGYRLADRDDYGGYGSDNRSVHKTRTLVAIIMCSVGGGLLLLVVGTSLAVFAYRRCKAWVQKQQQKRDQEQQSIQGLDTNPYKMSPVVETLHTLRSGDDDLECMECPPRDS
ncbi:hypothetical protein ElyMa_005642400 [Elysia marginata]|uniref:Uncharacterized protein n=1 Tax=Elysia marginata TaxID=1093978 RepID=A0AAV4FAL0_9GAST|nr:hypothetical protein ElyMa_005642400 [Elysia marginata]